MPPGDRALWFREQAGVRDELDETVGAKGSAAEVHEGWKIVIGNDIKSLVDALGKNDSLERLDLSLAGFEWMPPIAREERSALCVGGLLEVVNGDPKALEALETFCEARQADGIRCLARLRFGGRMPSMAAVARSLQEVYDDVEIVHLLTDAKAERTVVMTWRDTWRNESYELG